MSASLSVNTNISHYRILSQLGAGGMGEVWLAEDTRLDRKVALKLLPAAFTRDAGRVRRFIQEAKAASALNHPNIFSLGLMFYELATGRYPFTASSPVGLLNAIIADTPTPPSQLNQQLPAELEDLILRMLEKEASKRPTAVEVDQRLVAIGRQRAGATGRFLSPSLPVSQSSSRKTVGREKERWTIFQLPLRC